MPRYYFHLSGPDESFRDPIGFELSDLSAAQKGDAMITSDELMSHAARCTRLAEVSKDKAVAEKFRQLARDYCDLATSKTTRANASEQSILTSRRSLSESAITLQ